MKQRHYKYAVYGYEHPAFFTTLLSRHRWRFTARIAAWWFRDSYLVRTRSWSQAWVRDEEVIVACLPTARIER